MHRDQVAIVTSIAALLSGAALAQDDVSIGLYARVEGGFSLPEKLDQNLTYNPDMLFIVTPASQQTVDAGTGYAVGGAIGFRYESGFRTEMEYRYHSSDIDGVSLSGGGLGPSTAIPDASQTAHFLMSNVVYELRNSTPFTPFLGGGVGAAWVTSWTGPGAMTERDLTYAWQGRAGISLAINSTTRIGAEYLYVRTGELTFGPETFTPTGPAGPKIDGGKFAASTALVSFEKAF